MRCIYLLFFIINFIFFQLINADPKPTKNIDQPIINTPLGQIQGSILASKSGKQIFSFRGIRYGKAPINELRFQPPVQADKWEGIYNATQDGPLCPQPTTDPTSEDCLFLNIYTTKLYQNNDKSKRPVLVFIHGGGWYTLGSSSYWLGPQYLLNHDMILVTFNYRLGSLGFLSTGDKEAPGNNGMKDQVLALKWIKQNIGAFGGDPDSITLSGYSAGAVSVTLHMVSPMSQGLFHKAIIMSGSGFGNWPIPRSQMNLAKKQATILSCPDDNSANIIKCLKTKSASEIGDSLMNFREFGNDPIIIWTPVIEEDFGQERFLPMHPIQILESGKFNKVPVIAGITSDEFAERAFVVNSNETLKQKFINEFEKIAPIAFIYEREGEHSKQITNGLKKLYFNDNFNDNFLPSLAKLYSDSLVGFGVHRAVKLLSAKNCTVFYYRFSYKGRFSHFYLPESNGTVPYGVVHNDDQIYLFYIQKVFPIFKDTDPESQIINKLTLMWYNFIKNSKPITESSDKLDNSKWESYNSDNQQYLDIGNKLVLNEKLNENYMDEWETLFPINLYTKGKKHAG